MTFGPVFKAFRESKGYQAQEVAEGVVSVQFLRRFEKGEADIRLSNFSLLLGRINVSFNDFLARTQADATGLGLETLEKELDLIIITNDSIAMERKIAHFAVQYKQSGDEKYQHYEILVELLSNQVFHTNYPVRPQQLLTYLQRCDTWCSHEFFLANYATGFFDDRPLFTLAEMALERTIKMRSVRHYMFDFLFHACTEFVRRGLYEQAMHIIHAFRKHPNVQPILQFVPFHLAFAFIEGIITGIQADPKGYETCEKSIDFLYHTVGYTEYANNMQKFYRQIRSRAEKG